MSINNLNEKIHYTKGKDIVADTVLPLTYDGDYFDVLGSGVNITSFTSLGKGMQVILTFLDVCTLKYNDPFLILPDSSDVTTTPNMSYHFIEYDIGKWILVSGSTGGGGTFDANAIHTNRSNEISNLPLLDSVDIVGDEEFVIESPINSNAKRKVILSEFSANDINAFHKNVSNEINTLTEKLSLSDNDTLLIEDSNGGSFDKKKVTISSVSIDQISEGTSFKKMTSDEQTKLSGIEDGADVTDSTNVTSAESTIPVNAHSDITSPGSDIEDAVTKRHTQGTDTALGIQTEDADWGSYKITNVGEPIDEHDVATKYYVDNNMPTLELTYDGTPLTYDGSQLYYSNKGDDINAIHRNVPNEINQVLEKTTPNDNDIILIEDSENSWDKKKLNLSNLVNTGQEISYENELKGYNDNYYYNNYYDWLKRGYDDSECPVNLDEHLINSLTLSNWKTIFIGSNDASVQVVFYDDNNDYYTKSFKRLTVSTWSKLLPVQTHDGVLNLISLTTVYTTVKSIYRLDISDFSDLTPWALNVGSERIVTALGLLDKENVYLLIATNKYLYRGNGVIDIYDRVFQIPSGVTITAMFHLSYNEIIVYGYNGSVTKIYYSNDMGVTFVEQTTEIPFYVNHVEKTAGLSCICLNRIDDNTSNIYRSLNGIFYDSPPLVTINDTVKSLRYIGYSTIIAGGSSSSDETISKLWISFDNGETWDEEVLEYNDLGTIFAIEFNPMSKTLCLGGSLNKIYYKTFGIPSKDLTSIHYDKSDEVNKIPEKTIPNSSDILLLEDSEDSWVKKKLNLSTLVNTDQEINYKDELRGYNDRYSYNNYYDWLKRGYSESLVSFDEQLETSIILNNNTICFVGTTDLNHSKLVYNDSYYNSDFTSLSVTTQNYSPLIPVQTPKGKFNLIEYNFAVDRTIFRIDTSTWTFLSSWKFSPGAPAHEKISVVLGILDPNAENLLIATVYTLTYASSYIYRGNNTIDPADIVLVADGMVSAMFHLSYNEIIIYSYYNSETKIYYSDDQGLTFSEQLAALPFHIQHVEKIAGNSCVWLDRIDVNTSKIYLSSDGINYDIQPLITINDNVKSLRYIGYNTIIAGGSSSSDETISKLWVSFDNGKIWEEEILEYNDLGTITAMEFCPMTKTLCLGGSLNKIYYKTFGMTGQYLL